MFRMKKGVVLTGPPGSGKTYMVKAWLGENTEVQDLMVYMNDLSEPGNPYEGLVENLERVYDIAKMISPSLVFFDEGDAVAPRRSQQGGTPYDKVTNKFLSIIDGEAPLHHVFTVLTTNRLDILDPALIRSKRLKVMSVSGQMREEDSVRILRKEMKGIPLAEGLKHEDMVRIARGLCDTPADFTAYAEKVRSLRKTEVEVLGQLAKAVAGTEEERMRFVRFNYKTLLNLLEGIPNPSEPIAKARYSEEDMPSMSGRRCRTSSGTSKGRRLPHHPAPPGHGETAAGPQPDPQGQAAARPLPRNRAVGGTPGRLCRRRFGPTSLPEFFSPLPRHWFTGFFPTSWW